jgi:hypothetical protein
MPFRALHRRLMHSGYLMLLTVSSRMLYLLCCALSPSWRRVEPGRHRWCSNLSPRTHPSRPVVCNNLVVSLYIILNLIYLSCYPMGSCGDPYPDPWKTCTHGWGYGFSWVWIWVQAEIPWGYPWHSLNVSCSPHTQVGKLHCNDWHCCDPTIKEHF